MAIIEAEKSRVNLIDQSILPKAEEALRLARLGYRFGKFSLIDVLDAAAIRDETRANLITAKENLALSSAALMRLTTSQMENIQ